MEANPLQNTEPGSTGNGGAQDITKKQGVLAQSFYRILQKVLDQATENGNTGA